MNKQQLASKIWESANKMRSKIEANEYKDYILGFIFYKFLSDKEERQLRADGMTDKELAALSESDADAVRYCQDKLGYFIAYDNLFSTWLKKDAAKTFVVSDVQDALTAFARLVGANYKPVFDKIFDTLQLGLRKLGESTGAQTKAVAALLQLIKDIPMDGRQDYDVLGFIYEYLISNFAANAGKKAGEFYTPHEVSVMMSEIIAHHLQGREEIQIYDPTSGSGSLLINIGKSVAKFMHDRGKIKYYAQELKENTYNLTRMNLVMRGIDAANIATRNADTLEEDWPMADESGSGLNPLYVDAVVSNPPYSQNWTPDDAKKSDPRYSFGLAPKSKADYAFLLHDLYHIKPDGIMTIVLPHGVLFRGDEEGEIRKNLIEHNHIDAVIGLPPDIFFGTGIPTLVMVLKKQRSDDGVFFVDASRGFVKSGKKNKLRACDIRRIVDAVVDRKDIAKFSRLVSRDEIRRNDYNLNIPRYVDSSDDPETWDLYATMAGGVPESEIDSLDAYWKVFRGLREALFTSDGTPYARLMDGDLQDLTEKHKSVRAFRDVFTKAVYDLPDYLSKELLDGVMTLSVVQEADRIAAEIFRRLEDVPLVNPYDAYQHLAECWAQTANDLEMIQQEGFEAVRLVDPNMVLKKKDGKEQEVQDGWVGHIIPFDLVQRMLLADEAKKIADKERELEEAGSRLLSLIDEMDDDDKEKYLNDDNDAFDGKKVSLRVTEIFAEQFGGLRVKKAGQLQYLVDNGNLVEGSIDDILVKALTTIEQEKVLKKAIKDMRAALHELTKQTVESLSDDDARMLLEQKWIQPLYARIYSLSNGVVDSLIEAVRKLAAKYAETFNDVEKEIRSAEKELRGLFTDLAGDEFDIKGIRQLLQTIQGDVAVIPKALGSIAQKLFPQNDKTVPEIRFGGFKSEWKKISIGDIGEWGKGQALSKHDIDVDGKRLCIHYGELFTDYGIVISEVHKRTNVTPLVISRSGDILFPVSDVTPDGLGRCSAILLDGVILGGDLLVLRPLCVKCESTVLSSAINAKRHEFLRYVTGSTVRHLSRKSISQMEILLPTDIDEQQKIGAFFRNLDRLIGAAEKKVAKLRQVKASLLERMFV